MLQREHRCINSVTSNNLQNKVHMSHSLRKAGQIQLCYIYSVIENIFQMKLLCIFYDSNKEFDCDIFNQVIMFNNKNTLTLTEQRKSMLQLLNDF